MPEVIQVIFEIVSPEKLAHGLMWRGRRQTAPILVPGLDHRRIKACLKAPAKLKSRWRGGQRERVARRDNAASRVRCVGLAADEDVTIECAGEDVRWPGRITADLTSVC